MTMTRPTISDTRLELLHELNHLASLPLEERPTGYGLRRHDLWRRAMALAPYASAKGPVIQPRLLEVTT